MSRKTSQQLLIKKFIKSEHIVIEAINYFSAMSHSDLFSSSRGFNKNSRNTMFREIMSVQSRLAGKYKDNIKCGSYPYIPLDFSTFAILVSIARTAIGKYTKASFLDVGCGIGDKVLLASSVFDFFYGLEYVDAYIKEGEKLFSKFGRYNTIATKTGSRFESPFIKGDALEFSGYGDYQVIYFYCPFSDCKKEEEFEDKLLLDMKRGTIVIPVGGQSIKDSKKLKFISLDVYIKI